MNQKSRQKVTSSAEKDFFKLLNNSSFGTDCRNNIDNCILEPIYDDFTEISYIKEFTTIFNDDTFREFFSSMLLREEITETFQSKIFALDKNEPTYAVRKKYYENQQQKNQMPLILSKKIRKQKKENSFEKNKKESKKKEIQRYR